MKAHNCRNTECQKEFLPVRELELICAECVEKMLTKEGRYLLDMPWYFAWRHEIANKKRLSAIVKGDCSPTKTDWSQYLPAGEDL